VVPIHLVLIDDEAVGPSREARLLTAFIDASVSEFGGAEDSEELAVDFLVVLAALGVAMPDEIDLVEAAHPADASAGSSRFLSPAPENVSEQVQQLAVPYVSQGAVETPLRRQEEYLSAPRSTVSVQPTNGARTAHD
jgi:hypothetical protein